MFFIVVLPVCTGIGIAIYEHRKKTVLLKHDFNQRAKGSTEADRDITRARRDHFENHID